MNPISQRIISERCKAAALLNGVKPARKEEFFANRGTETSTFLLDTLRGNSRGLRGRNGGS
jgi:hypothetical protein